MKQTDEKCTEVAVWAFSFYEDVSKGRAAYVKQDVPHPALIEEECWVLEEDGNFVADHNIEIRGFVPQVPRL